MHGSTLVTDEIEHKVQFGKAFKREALESVPLPQH